MRAWFDTVRSVGVALVLDTLDRTSWATSVPRACLARAYMYIHVDEAESTAQRERGELHAARYIPARHKSKLSTTWRAWRVHGAGGGRQAGGWRQLPVARSRSA